MTTMDRESTGFELKEPPSPEALVPSHGWTPWAFAAAGILALLLIALILITRKRKPTGPSRFELRMAAFNHAKSALESMSPETCREAAIQSSLILRHYLATAANDPALYETHEEFISRHDSLQALTETARIAAEAGFSRLASLKYAPSIPENDPMSVVSDCLALLSTLHQGFAK